MMTRLVLLVLGLAFVPTLAQTPPSSTDLSKTYPAKLGHFVSLALRDAVVSYMQGSNWDAPLLVGYDAKENLIAIRILGSRTSIDSVKQSVDEFRKKILPSAFDFVGQMYGIRLSEENIRITYTSRATGKTLLQFHGGEYSLE